MSTCNTQALMDSASAMAALPPGLRYPVKLALWVRLLKQLNPSYVLNVQQLVTDASCFVCVSAAFYPLLKLRVLCNILGGNPSTPCVNIIPVGEIYHLFGTTILTTPGATYQVVFGPNDVSLVNGSDTITSSGDGDTHTFVAAEGTVRLLGPIGTIIGDTLCLIE